MPNIPQLTSPVSNNKSYSFTNRQYDGNIEPFDMVELAQPLKAAGASQDESGSAAAMMMGRKNLAPLTVQIKDPTMAVETLKNLLSSDILEQTMISGYTELYGDMEELIKSFYLSPEKLVEEIRNQEPEKIYPVVGLLTPLPPETIRMRPTIADNPLYYQKGQYAVKQNDAQKSVSIELLGINGTPAGIEFYDKDQPIDSDAWALYVDMCYQVESAKNGVCSFFITQDERNAACIKFVQKVTGDSYIKRSIYRDGERMQQVEESGNAPDEHLLQIPSGTEWSGKLLFMFYDGWI